MGERSSAEPDRLEAYGRGSDDQADDCLRRIGLMEDALAQLAATRSEGLPAWGGLTHSVRLDSVAHRRLGDWVGFVAQAFRQADIGTIPPPPGFGDPGLCHLANTMERIRGALARGDVRAAVMAVISRFEPGDQPDPTQVATLATAFTPAQLTTFAEAYPHLVGPIDGWPPRARYRANRVLIEQAIASNSGERRTKLERLLADDPMTGAPRQFLHFDDDGDGQVAEVFGAIDTAGSVAIYVPGMGSDIENFDSSVASRARNLYLAAMARHPERGVAVVAWLGYDAPDALPSIEAVGVGRAREGGRNLSRTVAGLALAADQDLTLVAHSYGTVAVGAALRGGVRARRVLVMGSPGMLIDRAEQLGREGQTGMYTMEAPGDLVADLERFGSDPNDSDSGFTRLETGGRGHSTYLTAGSISVANAAALVVGDEEDLVRLRRSRLELPGSG